MPKGSKAALWNLAFIRGFGGETCGLCYVFARVQFTRFRPARGVLRTVSTDSIVLHVMQRNCWNLKNNQPDLLSEAGWLRRNFYLPWQRSTQSAWKQCGARHARLNRVKCTVARWYNQSTSGILQNITPRGFKGIAIPLARLSPLSFAVQRKMESPKGVGMVERSVKTYHLNDGTTDSP